MDTVLNAQAVDTVEIYDESGTLVTSGVTDAAGNVELTMPPEATDDALKVKVSKSGYDDKEFEVFPPHCVRGTEEAEIIPELQQFADEVIPKIRFSGFYGTNLDERLRELNPDKIIVVGDCTDICVMHTVADARNRDYLVEVPADCVATFDQEAHRYALQHMEKILGAKVVGLSAEGTREG